MILLMKKLLLILSLIPLTSLAKPEPAKLRYSLEFIFEKVLEKKRQAHRPEIPFPRFFYESSTPLKQFQDAVEPQWGFRPERITNAFILHHNDIYILDEAAYYQKTGRCMDDSVAHELVHYVQGKYQGWDLHDDSLEWEAIDIQTAFREEFCSSPESH